MAAKALGVFKMRSTLQNAWSPQDPNQNAALKGNLTENEQGTYHSKTKCLIKALNMNKVGMRQHFVQNKKHLDNPRHSDGKYNDLHSSVGALCSKGPITVSGT